MINLAMVQLSCHDTDDSQITLLYHTPEVDIKGKIELYQCNQMRQTYFKPTQCKIYLAIPFLCHLYLIIAQISEYYISGIYTDLLLSNCMQS